MIIEVHPENIIAMIKILESTDSLGRWVELYVNRHVSIKVDRIEYLKTKGRK